PWSPGPRRGTRVSKGAANLLDRAIWLLLQRSELWDHLDGAAHDLLAAQPGPYDALFSGIERSVHEHGPLAPAALLDELRQAVGATGEGPVVLARIAALHDPEPESDIAGELARVLAKLRLKLVDDELKLLFETDATSPDALRRGRELMEERSRLKAS
ncbi:MAG: DNA primase, partial [Pseudomonadota bacterium]|nr:DNA primase [Pseudomonadota bacterium]